MSDAMKRSKVTVEIENNPYEWQIKDLIAHLQRIAQKIDDGTFSEISVIPQLDDDYGSYRSYLEISGEREENDEEYEKRKEFLEGKVREREEDEKKEL
jgi:hypothetical protein